MTKEYLLRYKDVRDRDLRKEKVFICEGRTLVHRLITSDYEIESILCTSRFADEFRTAAAGQCPVLVQDETVITNIVGFKFHRGVLACGRRKPIPFIEELPQLLPQNRSIVVLPDLTSQENVGGIIRSAAALGTEVVILGSRCSDPFGRKALKVSMGTVFNLSLFHSSVPTDMKTLKDAGYTVVGTIPSQEAIPVNKFLCPPKTAVLIGGEASGLSPEWKDQCDLFVTIPMRPGIDSLNASVAAGIVLFYIHNPPLSIAGKGITW